MRDRAGSVAAPLNSIGHSHFAAALAAVGTNPHPPNCFAAEDLPFLPQYTWPRFDKLLVAADEVIE